ncbi:F-box/LRR-repeat protein At5g63520-like [Prunus avium]|uniref:F-box/LRR-repeat protein At5g63520-like n=1 Tax=Prunus avium TaxID=42229 RepID=A0A6P5SXF6_PRUAV|nr:F-box/LRR-repeat protein At5g63520-like [Prunus avium]
MAAKPDMVAEVEMADAKGVFSPAHDDVSVNILARPPAVSFASSAACVGKTWNQSCNKILSRPQFSSALSLNPDLHAALDEVLADAFSKPLRPDFIVAYIGTNFSLEETHHLITEKVGLGIPVITNKAKGLIGTDVQTDKLREVIWGSTDGDSERNENNSNRGIVLSVGYMPGLKVDVIPLLRPKNEQQLTMVDHFPMEIMDFTCAASGSLSPSCIIMFGDKNVDMNPILTILDQVMPDETAIVGDAGAAFLCTRMDEAENYNKDVFSFAAAALVFAKDLYKPEGISLCRTVLYSAANYIKKPDMYIGVTQRGNYSILEKPPSSSRQRRFVEESPKKITRRRRKKKKGESKSLTDLEFEELNGFMDLGFVFLEEDKEDSNLASIIPGLQRLGKKDGQDEVFDESTIPRSYLSKAWKVRDQRKREKPLMNWRFPALGNEIDMKDNLRWWAHTVASTAANREFSPPSR